MNKVVDLFALVMGSTALSGPLFTRFPLHLALITGLLCIEPRGPLSVTTSSKIGASYGHTVQLRDAVRERANPSRALLFSFANEYQRFIWITDVVTG